MILESKNNPIEKEQTWITGAKDEDGWFMLRDSANEAISQAKEIYKQLRTLRKRSSREGG